MDGTPSPVFFVSVASKGVRFSVSLLFATLAGRSISVAAKGVTLRCSERAVVGFSLWRQDREASRGWWLTITTYVTIEYYSCQGKVWGAKGLKGKGIGEEQVAWALVDGQGVVSRNGLLRLPVRSPAVDEFGPMTQQLG
jgi:hypothetical protein